LQMGSIGSLLRGGSRTSSGFGFIRTIFGDGRRQILKFSKKKNPKAVHYMYVMLSSVIPTK